MTSFFLSLSLAALLVAVGLLALAYIASRMRLIPPLFDAHAASDSIARRVDFQTSDVVLGTSKSNVVVFPLYLGSDRQVKSWYQSQPNSSQASSSGHVAVG